MRIRPSLSTVDLEQAVERERRLQRRNVITIALYAWFCFGTMSMVFASVAGTSFPLTFAVGAVGGVIGGAFTIGGVRLVHWVAEQSLRGLLEPGGRGRNPVTYSHAEAQAVRGNFTAAAKAFEDARATHGERASLLRAEADVHLRTDGIPERARELLMRLRKVADATRADELYATHRLIDLYLGPLNDELRAMSELRRLTERFPGTPDADGAQAELDRRRAQRKIDHQDRH